LEAIVTAKKFRSLALRLPGAQEAGVWVLLRRGGLAGKSEAAAHPSRRKDAGHRLAQKRLAIHGNAAKPPAVKRLVLLLGAVAFAASVATAAETITIEELRAMAEAGDAEAQVGLGGLFYLGQGVAKDEVEAVKWYRKAAEQGYAMAQSKLGFMYDNGLGVAKDEVEAGKWFRKAAEEGFADAQFNLGVMYDKGQGVAKDEVEAVKWYRKAAEQGIAMAQINLGVRYANGTGVAKDQVEAYAWFNLAAIKDESGKKNRKILEETLSREEIAAGQRRTRELQKEIEAKQKGAPGVP